MNQSLSEMIKDENLVFGTDGLDLPDASQVPEMTEEETTEETIEAGPAPVDELIPVTSMNTWFDANCSAFENISQVKVAIRGVDPSKTLIMAIMDGQGDVDGHPSRDLQIFKHADIQPVLNMPASGMEVYNNGFRLIYPYDDGMVIKCYGVRTGLVCVFCNVLSDQMIPYALMKVKKKDTDVKVVRKDVTEVIQKLTQDADLEAVQLLYKQSSRYVDEFNTNSSVVSWLLTRQSEVTDVYHHIQIDNVIISIMK